MAEKNHKEQTTVMEHLLLEIEVGFELLWRCISNILNRINPKEVYERHNSKTRIIQTSINNTVEFLMFISVSTPFKLITGVI